MKLLDVKDMPGFNPTVPNGTDNVSKGEVMFGKLPWMPEKAVETVCCIMHGAMLCVAVQKDGKLWRCPTCNRGAFQIDEQ